MKDADLSEVQRPELKVSYTASGSTQANKTEKKVLPPELALSPNALGMQR